MNHTCIFLLILSVLVNGVEAQTDSMEPKKSTYYHSKSYYPGLDVTELVLHNGMKVFLKPTNEDEDEVQIRLFALGGYSSFSIESQILADTTVATGWECGFGDLTIDQRSVVIYENSIEFSPKIGDHYRMIEGSAPTDSLPDYLQLVKAYFAEQRFTLEKFEEVLKIKKSLLHDEPKEASLLQKAIPLHDSPCCNLNPKELFPLAKDLFQKSFINPSEFICVIVGDFQPEKTIKMLHKYLGAISMPEPSFKWSDPLPLSTVRNTIYKVEHTHDHTHSIVRIILPINKKMTPEGMLTFKLASRVVESRLNTLVGSSTVSFNVRDELTNYPSLDSAVMVIQFRSPTKGSDELIERVKTQVERLCQEGPIPSEVVEQIRIHIEKENLWVNCNEFWLSSLTSYVFWKAPLESILHSVLDEEKTYENIRDFLQTSVKSHQFAKVSIAH